MKSFNGMWLPENGEERRSTLGMVDTTQYKAALKKLADAAISGDSDIEQLSLNVEFTAAELVLQCAERGKEIDLNTMQITDGPSAISEDGKAIIQEARLDALEKGLEAGFFEEDNNPREFINPDDLSPP